MTEIILVAVIIILVLLLLLREWQYRTERKELLDRIMSVDYQLFKRSERAAGGSSRPHVLPARMTDAELAKAAREADNA